MNDVRFDSIEPKKKNGFKKFVRWFFFILVLALGIFIYWKFYFPFTKDGVKSGYLNYVVYKGQLFKTYEGKLIQQGLKAKGVGIIGSNEFEFSIKNKRIYDQLKMNSGKFFDLQYKEYNGVIPWRGNTVYIVDSVLAMRDAE